MARHPSRSVHRVARVNDNQWGDSRRQRRRQHLAVRGNDVVQHDWAHRLPWFLFGINAKRNRLQVAFGRWLLRLGSRQSLVRSVRMKGMS
jgi:hypothetical protein